jgi:CBS domain containing-hemolysin-like protein
MIAIVVVTLIAAGLSFLCSLMEAAFYSIPPSKIEELRRKGSRNGERLARLRENVDEPISAILTLNTFANTLGASVAGALVAAQFPTFEPAAAIYGIIFTIIILYISEIIPKTIGVIYAPVIAPRMSRLLVWLIIIFLPFVRPASLSRSRFRSALRKRHGQAPTEQEILALAQMGAEAGTILPDEARWAMNALRLNDVRVKDLRTPRNAVFTLPADLPLNMVSKQSKHWTFSRLPIVNNNNPDEVEGIVHRREVFDELVSRTPEELATRTLRDLSRPAVFVPDSTRCNELLRKFLDNRQQLIIVTDEYGGMEGVIALEDVLEFILGEEIIDPHDKYADMQEYARVLARGGSKSCSSAISRTQPRKSPEISLVWDARTAEHLPSDAGSGWPVPADTIPWRGPDE